MPFLSDPTAPATAPTPQKRLSPAEWEQVVVLWESGTVTLADLENKFGISKPSLHEGLKKRGSVKGSRSKEFAKATEESLKSDVQRKAEDVKGFRKKYQTYGDFIMQAAIVELQDLRKKARSERTREENARIFTSIKYTAEVYALVRDNKFHLYDLYNEAEQDEDLPEIGVAEYTAEEIDQIARRFDSVDPLLEEPMGDVLEEAHASLNELEEEIPGTT